MSVVRTHKCDYKSLPRLPIQHRISEEEILWFQGIDAFGVDAPKARPFCFTSQHSQIQMNGAKPKLERNWSDVTCKRCLKKKGN